MTEKRIPRPRNPLALTKLIGDIATGHEDFGGFRGLRISGTQY